MTSTPLRMTGEARREQILSAALPAFAEGGYAGTTTDQVARAAGVSQPYVVRLFGSKKQLFLELYQQVSARDLVGRRAGVATLSEGGERGGQDLLAPGLAGHAQRCRGHG